MWIEQVQIHKKNRIAGTHPLTKLWIVAIYILAYLLLMTIHTNTLPLGGLVSYGFLLILVFLSAIGPLFIKKSGPIYFLVLIILLSQTLLIHGQTPIGHFFIFTIYFESIRKGFTLSLSLLNISGILLWFFLTTQNEEWIYALEEKGMNRKISFVLLSTFQTIQQLRLRSTRILEAQQARGLEIHGSLIQRAKAFLPSLIPIILSALSDNGDRVLCLEAKGFHYQGPHTQIIVIRKNGYEKYLLLGGCLYLCLVCGVVIFL